jgi:hypothetical protein
LDQLLRRHPLGAVPAPRASRLRRRGRVEQDRPLSRGDPRDSRGDDAFYELIGDDDGLFGCMSLLACHDVCPKQLPLSTQIAFLRRKMARIGL